MEAAQKILTALKPPYAIANHYLHVTGSIGISLYPTDGRDADTLIKHADVALYIAKDYGRDRYQFYSPAIHNQASELLVLENCLHYAWQRGEFEIYYQPKVSISTGKITSMEALLRWKSPELGEVSPSKFIPIAEENGQIILIGEWVLKTACEQMKTWIDASLPPIRIAVNLSARQFQQQGLVETVAQTLESFGLEPSLLELEVTETTAMQNMNFTKEVLNDLHAVGVLLTMDDFGTGYSSLNYLKQFPLHTIKIDQSFVRDIVNDICDRAIANAVIALGHGLGMIVVAEGVETREQLECLRALGCDEMQGYFFSQPLSDKEATTLLIRQKSFMES